MRVVMCARARVCVLGPPPSPPSPPFPPAWTRPSGDGCRYHICTMDLRVASVAAIRGLELGHDARLWGAFFCSVRARAQSTSSADPRFLYVIRTP